MFCIHTRSLAAGALLALASLLAMSATRSPATSGDAEEILSYLSLVDLDNGVGGRARTLRIEGVNLQIVDGSGDTEGPTNSVGNLIVGYNEPRAGSFFRTGSHNLIVGRDNDYGSFGGVVSCLGGEIDGPYCSVFGGRYNEARGDLTTVCGGERNVADGFGSLVAGGSDNSASNTGSVALGGERNAADGFVSVVLGGRDNQADVGGSFATVVGGEHNTAKSRHGTIAGGANNTTLGGASRSNIIASFSCVTDDGTILGSDRVSLLGTNQTIVCGGFDRAIGESDRWFGGNCVECDRNE